MTPEVPSPTHLASYKGSPWGKPSGGWSPCVGPGLNKHLVTRMSSGLLGKGSEGGDGKEARPGKAQKSEWTKLIHSFNSSFRN